MDKENKDKKSLVPQTFEEKTDNVIVEHNDFINRSRYNLSLPEQKILKYAISEVDPRNQLEFDWCKITLQDFIRLSGRESLNPSKNDYEAFASYIESLDNKNYHIRTQKVDENGNKVYDKYGRPVWVQEPFKWLETYKMEFVIDPVTKKRRGTEAYIKLHNAMKPYLMQLENRYTHYPLKYILPMKSKFSIRMYEQLLEEAYKGEIQVYTVDEIKDMLFVDENGERDDSKYTKYSDFRKRVLNVVIEEINRYTNLSVKIVREEKEKRIVRKIHFEVFRKDMQPVRDETADDSTIIDVPEDKIVSADGKYGLFEYKDGSSKPVFKEKIREKLGLSFTHGKSINKVRMMNYIINQYASLANKHGKGDVRIDGGNVKYIDLFNEMIKKNRLEKFCDLQIDKYTSREFDRIMTEKPPMNEDAYRKVCITRDVENWEQFIAVSEKTYYEEIEVLVDSLRLGGQTGTRAAGYDDDSDSRNTRIRYKFPEFEDD